MTDFETHPVGTAARIAELEVALALVTAREASRNHERLEALNKNAWQASRIEQLEATLTRANAATAAAYEAAAGVASFRHDENKILRATWATPSLTGLDDVSDEIRALATPDQTAALEKLIAEAVKPYVEALIWCSGSPDFNDGGFARKGWLKLCAPLILAASKKGGV